ncbi:MAG TPA: tetratricopeptide repeat protein, partial [Gammaproteobacteria bacterium]|nr:tetratricopeptide repeat protein [Gammaproteobacteria bacterium]
AEAMRWYRKAAEQDDANAQFTLGIMYDQGKGVPQNFAEAQRWYRKAAEQRHLSAQFKLGYMYYRGRGVPQDYVKAHKWWNLVATAGRASAVAARNDLAELMTPEEIAEAEKLALEWVEKQKNSEP